MSNELTPEIDELRKESSSFQEYPRILPACLVLVLVFRTDTVPWKGVQPSPSECFQQTRLTRWWKFLNILFDEQCGLRTVWAKLFIQAHRFCFAVNYQLVKMGNDHPTVLGPCLQEISAPSQQITKHRHNVAIIQQIVHNLSPLFSALCSQCNNALPARAENEEWLQLL